MALRRNNSAHLHRPRRATYATAEAAPPACAASGRILAATPRRFGSQPKISKTTPCKVAGGRRPGRFGPTLDTSGKSPALLHHRTIRQTPVAAIFARKPWRHRGKLGRSTEWPKSTPHHAAVLRLHIHRDDGGAVWAERSSMAFAIKAEVCDPRAKTFAFAAQKTMYGGKQIAEGDTVFVFASEDGQGLIARGVVTSAAAIAKTRGITRQTPRVSVTIRRTALASGGWGGASSNISPSGMTASPGPSSISNSIVRPRTRSSASRMQRRRSSADSSRAFSVPIESERRLSPSSFDAFFFTRTGAEVFRAPLRGSLGLCAR